MDLIQHEMQPFLKAVFHEKNIFLPTATASFSSTPVGIVMICLMGIPHILFFLFAAPSTIISALPDDAFYYMQVARNLMHGQGSTFDGIHLTNGYHPLWLITILPLFSFDFSPEFTMRLVLLLQVLIALASTMVLLQMLRRLFTGSITVLILLLWYPLVFVRVLNGMESALLMFCLLLSCTMMLNSHGVGSKKQLIYFGLMLSVTMLARLDMCFFAVPALFFHITSGPKSYIRTIVWRASFVTIGFLALFVPYICSNLFFFKEVIPLSGSLKSSFPHLAGNTLQSVFNANQWPIANVAIILSVVMYISILIFVSVTRRSFVSNSFDRMLAALAIMVLLHFAYVYCFVAWGIWSWYFVPYGLFATLLGGRVCQWISNAYKQYKLIVFPSMLVLLVVAGVSRTSAMFNMKTDRAFGALNYQAATWVRSCSSESDIFAYSDCGIFAFFSKRRVLNLDGLMNDREYQTILNEQHLRSYLRDNGVRYLIVTEHFPVSSMTSVQYTNTRLCVYSALFRRMSDTISLTPQDRCFRVAKTTRIDLTTLSIFRNPY